MNIILLIRKASCILVMSLVGWPCWCLTKGAFIVLFSTANQRSPWLLFSKTEGQSRSIKSISFKLCTYVPNYTVQIWNLTSNFYIKCCVQLCSGITYGRMLNGEFNAQRFQELIYLYLFTELLHKDHSTVVQTNKAMICLYSDDWRVVFMKQFCNLCR